LNKVFVHRLSIEKGTFVPHEPAFLGLKSPANPRHLVFHPNGKWAYVANEANPGCTVLSYDPDRGAFREAGVTRTIPDEITGRVSPAEAVMHPTGAFVYLSNRGHDSIAVLKIDRSDGSLTLVEARQPGGSGPRSFNIDPTGNWLFALMQRSNSIVPLRIDGKTGRLTRSGDILSLPSPVCAKFVQLS
jgi:6-phosphogluconolactonase